MKLRKPLTVLLAAAASLALSIGVAAPADATSSFTYGGTLNCPSFMTAQVSFSGSDPSLTTVGSEGGSVRWWKPGTSKMYYSNFTLTNKTHSYLLRAPAGGAYSYSVVSPVKISVYATCSI